MNTFLFQFLFCTDEHSSVTGEQSRMKTFLVQFVSIFFTDEHSSVTDEQTLLNKFLFQFLNVPQTNIRL